MMWNDLKDVKVFMVATCIKRAHGDNSVPQSLAWRILFDFLIHVAKIGRIFPVRARDRSDDDDM